jgi:inorganic pyrophosphatase
MPPMAYANIENPSETPSQESSNISEYPHESTTKKVPTSVRTHPAKIVIPRHSNSECLPFKNTQINYFDEKVKWPLQTLPFQTKSECGSFKHEETLQSEVSNWKTIEFGSSGTLGYRMLFLDSEWNELSPWHDIPLSTTSGSFNFICTTPKGCWAEYEFAKEEPFTPIKLSSKNGEPLHYAENLRWNYGFFPQTWCKSSLHTGVELGRLPFDDNPLYVFELSSRNSKAGDVYAVKPIAAFAVKEFGVKLSWKILAIDVNDHMASISDAAELRQRFPGLQDMIRDWLKSCHCLQPGTLYFILPYTP